MILNKYLKYLKAFLFIIIPTLTFTLILSFFTYKNLLNNQISPYILAFTVLICFFTSGLYLGNKVEKKGFLEGIKIGLGTIILFVISSLIFKLKINLISIIYYSILLISSIIGSMIGIGKRKS